MAMFEPRNAITLSVCIEPRAQEPLLFYYPASHNGEMDMEVDFAAHN